MQRLIYFYSESDAAEVIHLNENCRGLERVSEDLRAAREVWNFGEIALSSFRRPCRICALQPALQWALGTERGWGSARTFVTFTSQPALAIDPTRFRRNKVTDSGVQRLREVADTTGLALVDTCQGLSAYGFIDENVVDVVLGNLRGAENPLITSLPEPGVIAAFWTFFDDVQRGEESSPEEAWLIATAVGV